jgi:hypothetical protein
MKMPRTTAGWLRMRDVAPEPDTTTYEDGDDNVVAMRDKRDLEQLYQAAVHAQREIMRNTADLERIQKLIDDKLQRINMRAVTEMPQ